MHNSKLASRTFPVILQLVGLVFLVCSPALAYETAFTEVSQPVATDSRIKTFVYSENDVFNLVTHYGYQSNIEFGLDESVDTISVGDRVPFQLVPAGRRLFVRALVTSARTNMTVVTNKHTYQFDLIAVPAPSQPNQELAYVVRFFYPGEAKNSIVLRAADAAKADNATALYNYKYTFSGSSEIEPLKVFDDGKSTYFKLRVFGGYPLKIFAVDGMGREVNMTTREAGEYIIADVVSPRFYIRAGDYMVAVYNERFAGK